jgi:hypothetical protein
MSLLVWLLLGAAPGAPEALSGDPPVRLTSDSAEYCQDLETRLNTTLHRLPTPPPLAVTLSAEGGDLCARGLVRGGITRLRQAMLIVRRSQPGQSQPGQSEWDQPERGQSAPH